MSAPEVDEFAGRVAIVTGAGGGLGRSYALALAARGCRVVVNDIGGGLDGRGTSDTAERVVAEITEAGGEALASAASVAERSGAAVMVAAAIARWGRLDLLINNAGILRDGTFAKTSLDDLDAVLAVHLSGTIYATHAAWPHFIAGGFGRVLMTTSTSALFGNFGQSGYDAAKLGVVGLMNALKLEGERHGIAVNTIAPLAASRLGERIFPPALFERMTHDPVVEVALRLCAPSCQASGLIVEAGAGVYAASHMSRSAPRAIAAGDDAGFATLFANATPNPNSAARAIAEFFLPLAE